jgi:hypothetical protein
MLQIPATVLLIDVENVIGPFKPRLPMVRARMQALLAAAGPVEHALAGGAVAGATRPGRGRDRVDRSRPLPGHPGSPVAVSGRLR